MKPIDFIMTVTMAAVVGTGIGLALLGIIPYLPL